MVFAGGHLVRLVVVCWLRVWLSQGAWACMIYPGPIVVSFFMSKLVYLKVMLFLYSSSDAIAQHRELTANNSRHFVFIYVRNVEIHANNA